MPSEPEVLWGEVPLIDNAEVYNDTSIETSEIWLGEPPIALEGNGWNQCGLNVIGQRKFGLCSDRVQSLGGDERHVLSIEFGMHNSSSL